MLGGEPQFSGGDVDKSPTFDTDSSPDPSGAIACSVAIQV
jgi:hypothetical protein